MADPSPPELHARAVELGFTKTKIRRRRARASLVVRPDPRRARDLEGGDHRPLHNGRPPAPARGAAAGRGRADPAANKKADLAADRRLVTTLYLSQAEFELFRNLPGKTLRKTRHHLGRGPDAHAIMVDRFEGALDGLLLAEVEFPSDEAMASYSAPDFALGAVTFDARYGGGELVRNGVPPEGLPLVRGL